MILRAAQKGLTMIEMVLTILILAIALIVITGILSSGVGRSSDTTLEIRSASLAQSLLDEFLGKRFDELSQPIGLPPCSSNCTEFVNFGPYAGETRARFDDVDDYHGLDEGQDPVNPLHDSTGAERIGYENFRVRVSVRYMDVSASGTEEDLAVALHDLDENEDAKVITVTVNYLNSGTEGIAYSAYKANF